MDADKTFSPDNPAYGSGGSVRSGQRSHAPSSAAATPRSAGSSKRTAIENAIHTLFAEFVMAAELKMNVILTWDLDRTVDIGAVLRHGADVTFDRAIDSVGSVAQHRLRSVTDAIMIWRKIKSEPVDLAFVKSLLGEDAIDPTRLRDVQLMLRERNMLGSNYILNRALIEIVRRITTPSRWEGDLGEKLEEMIFSQIKNAEPETLIQHPNRMLVIDMFAELLGAMSNTRFQSVTRRFVSELNHGTGNREATYELLIRCMRFVKLKLYPMDALEESVEFLHAIAELFQDASSPNIKYSFALTLTELLTPVSEIAGVEVNIPSWMKPIELCYHKALKMLAKPRNVPAILPLAVALLCVSKRDFFNQKWPTVLDHCIQRLKDKTTRTVALACLNRLVWMYVYRFTDSFSSTQKKLETIARSLFPPGRKPIVPTEVPLEMFSVFVCTVAGRYPDYAMKNLLLSLLTLDGSSATNFDHISPERIYIGIRSFAQIVKQGTDLTAFPADLLVHPSGHVPVQAAPVAVTPMSSSELADFNFNISMNVLKVIRLVDQNHTGLFIQTDDRFWTRNFGAGSSPAMPGGPVDLPATLPKEKMAYCELYRTWLATLPALLPPAPEEREVIDMLCRYTSHVDTDIAKASQDALVRISASSLDRATTVARSFHAHLLSISDKYAEAMQSAAAFYSVLWEAIARDLPAHNDIPSVDTLDMWAQIQDLESTGSFFLCSHISTVRRHGCCLLKTAAILHEFMLQMRRVDVAVKTPNAARTIWKVLESVGAEVIEAHSADYSGFADVYAERKNDVHFISELAGSDNAGDVHFWSKCFPDVIRKCEDACPAVLHDTLDIITQRLVSIHPSVVAAADPSKSQTGTLTGKWAMRTVIPASDELIDQWRYYLTFACVCVTITDTSSKETARKSGSGSDSLTSAQELFGLVMPLLASEKTAIRVAVVVSLGHCNFVIFKTLVEEMKSTLKIVVEDMRARYSRGSQRRVKKIERLRAEITHVFSLCADFVVVEDFLQDEPLVAFMLSFIRELGAFLSDAEVQLEWDHQMLRYYLCRLVERFYNGVASVTEASAIVPFDLRYSLFKLFEEWCGYGQRGFMMREREAKMIVNVLEQIKDPRERESLTLAMEEQRKALEYASLRAMSCLCKGPLMHATDANKLATFNLPAIFDWTEAIFQADDARLHDIAQSAVESLLAHNYHSVQTGSSVWEDVIQSCFLGDPNQMSTQRYFNALVSVTDVLTTSVPLWLKLFNLAIFKLADANILIRLKAHHLIQCIAQFQLHGPISDIYAIVCSPIPSTYKQALRVVCQVLSRSKPDIVYDVLSDLVSRIEIVDVDSCRDIIGLMLPPWIDTVDLKFTERFAALAQYSCMVLNNFFALTIKYGDRCEMEIQDMWRRLAKSPENVASVFRYIVSIVHEHRNLAIVLPARLICLYMARTAQQKYLLQLLLRELVPKSLIPSKKISKSLLGDIDSNQFFIADLGALLSPTTLKLSVSKGHLVLALIVDLVLELPDEFAAHMPLLLHVSLVHVDHHSTWVQSVGKALLQGLLNTQTRKSNPLAITQAATLSPTESLQLWSQDATDSRSKEIPVALAKLVENLQQIFASDIPDLRQDWGEVAAMWSTMCPVRHIACRSLHIYRSLSPVLTQKMVVEFIARLSNTISDSNEDVRDFAMEILTSINFMAKMLDADTLMQFPHLLWVCISCLESCNEEEFAETALLLRRMMDSVDLNDVAVRDCFMACTPPKMLQTFGGIIQSVARGVGSEMAESSVFSTLRRLSTADASASEIVGAEGTRWLYPLLAFLPRVLAGSPVPEYPLSEFIDRLHASGLIVFAKLLDNYSKSKYRSDDDFLRQFTTCIKEEFFPTRRVETVVFLLHYLKNKNSEIRKNVLKTIRIFLPLLDLPTMLDRVTTEILPCLFSLLATDFGSDVLKIVDELLEIVQPFSADVSLRSALLGQKAISKITRDGSVSLLKESGWQWNERAMSVPRTYLSDVVSNYMNTHDMSTFKEPMARSQSFTKSIHGAAVDNFEAEYEPLHSYDELLSTLKDLDEFFTGDIDEPAKDLDDRLTGKISGAEDFDDDDEDEVNTVIEGMLSDESHFYKSEQLSGSLIDSYLYDVDNEQEEPATVPADLNDGPSSLFTLADATASLATEKKLDMAPDLTQDQATPSRRMTQSRGNQQASRLLTLPAVNVYLLVPVLYNNERQTTQEQLESLRHLLADLSDSGVQHVAEKCTNTTVCLMFSTPKCTATENANAAEFCMSLITTRDKVLFADPRAACIDVNRRATISIGALDMLIAHSNPTSPLMHRIRPEVAAQSDGGVEARWASFCAIDTFRSPSQIGELALIAEVLRDDALQLLKSHLLAVSGQLPEAACRQAVNLMRNVRCIAIPGAGVFSTGESLTEDQYFAVDRSQHEALKAALKQCQQSLRNGQDSNNQLSRTLKEKKTKNPPRTSPRPQISEDEGLYPLVLESTAHSVDLNQLVSEKASQFCDCMTNFAHALLNFLLGACELTQSFHRKYAIACAPLENYVQSLQSVSLLTFNKQPPPPHQPLPPPPNQSPVLETTPPPPPPLPVSPTLSTAAYDLNSLLGASTDDEEL